ncbi:hypothetical protein ACQ4PT_062276 [Festuca glaucescens]
MPPKVSKRWVPVNRPAGTSPVAGKKSNEVPPKVSKRWVPVNQAAGMSPVSGKPSREVPPKVSQRQVPVDQAAGLSPVAVKPSNEMPPKVLKRWMPVNRSARTLHEAGNPSNEMPLKVSKQWVPVNQPSPVGTSRGAGEPADRLSDLPDVLLHHIMSFLKAWEMVHMSKLSRRWRNLWASAPCIDIRVGDHDRPPEDLAKFVHRLLLTRDVLTPVDTLRLRSLGEDDFYETYNNGHVKRWIRNAIKRNARVIQLNGHLSKYIELDHIDFVSSHLKILKLSYAKLDDKVMKQLSSHCPLEELDLKSCVIDVHEVLSFSLRSLTMVKCKFTMNLLVDASNLMFLRCIKPEKWVPVFKNSGSLITGSIMLDDSLLSREFQKYHEDDDEFPQTSDEDESNDNRNGMCDGKNSDGSHNEGFLDSILYSGFANDFFDGYSDNIYDDYSDDIKDNYDYGSDINSDDDTYEYSEIANDSEDFFGNCSGGLSFSKGGNNSGHSANYGFNDYKTLGGQNIIHSLFSARSIELLGHSGEVVLRRESISCPTFINLKTLSLGEWCISRGADFYLLIHLLQHAPNLEKLFLQLEMNFDIQKALGRCIKPSGGSFDCKHLRMVKIKCTKDDPSVHMLAQLFRANGVPLEKIYVRGSFHLRMLKLNREITLGDMRDFR